MTEALKLDSSGAVDAIATGQTDEKALALAMAIANAADDRKAEDIAKAAQYLLSDDASWITGQVLGIDGGMSSIRPL